MKDTHEESFASGAAAAIAEGGVMIPAILLRTYHKLGLSDAEVLLLLHLASFRQTENNEFPTLEQLGERLGVGSDAAGRLVQSLMKEGFLAIEQVIDPMTGIQSEVYDWQGWIVKAARLMRASRPAAGGAARGVDAINDAPSGPGSGARAEADAGGYGGLSAHAGHDIFSVFEREFGRPLSPMEMETISGWLDDDRYPEELVRFALKEAVFAGKLHFRYIDRILLEWSRNRVTNADEARAHAQRFRTGGRG